MLSSTRGGPPVTITLSPRLEALIREKIASGQYDSAEDVVGEAPRQMEERDQLQRLRAAVAEAEVARGETVAWVPDFMDRLKREAAENARRGRPIDDDIKP